MSNDHAREHEVTTRLGIIGAMQVELDLLLTHVKDDVVSCVSGSEFHVGTVEGVPVVIVRCGVGKVNAAMITQTLIDRFGATHVINTGVAGALDASLDIADLVVSTDAVHHDMDVTGLGYEPGFVPELVDEQKKLGKVAFEADESLRALVLRAASEAAPDATVVMGRVASGDLFVCESADKERIRTTFGASCCEMEGAAIAQVCWRNNVPFVIIRAISDKADETSKDEYRDLEAQTAQRSSSITLRAIRMLAQERGATRS